MKATIQITYTDGTKTELSRPQEVIVLHCEQLYNEPWMELPLNWIESMTITVKHEQADAKPSQPC